MQRTIARLPCCLSYRTTRTRRTFAKVTARYSSAFSATPAPPRLPKEEQEIFEKLQRQSTGAFSTPRPLPDSATATTSDLRAQINQSPDSSRTETGTEARIEEGEEIHPDIRRGALPEFEGDVNPKTGEVGGPKNEPLRWGAGGDWSFNGRVTDF